MCGCSANGVVAKQLSMGIINAVRGIPVQLLLWRQLSQVSFSVADELAIVAGACPCGGAKPG